MCKASRSRVARVWVLISMIYPGGSNRWGLGALGTSLLRFLWQSCCTAALLRCCVVRVRVRVRVQVRFVLSALCVKGTLAAWLIANAIERGPRREENGLRDNGSDGLS